MLTPAIVQDLRTSVHWRVSDGTTNHIPAHIIYSASEDAWMVYVTGRIMCMTQDIAVAGHLLRSERQEPGYVARILDPASPCDIASLAPSDRLAAEARIRSEHRAAAAYAAARDQAATRRRELIPPTAEEIQSLDLDDLLT